MKGIFLKQYAFDIELLGLLQKRRKDCLGPYYASVQSGVLPNSFERHLGHGSGYIAGILSTVNTALLSETPG